MRPHSVLLSLLLAAGNVAGCAADADSSGPSFFDSEAGAEIAATSQAVVSSTCGSGFVDIVESQGRVRMLSTQVTVLPGQPRLVESKVVARSIAGGDSLGGIMDAAKFQCALYNGNSALVTERTTTSQNAMDDGLLVTTHGQLALTTPGLYHCEIGVATGHASAKLRVYRDKTCITAGDLQVKDWPATSADEDTIGEGRRVNKGVPVYVLTRTFTFPAGADRAEFRAGIQLTNIMNDKSGIPGAGALDFAEPNLGEAFPPDPILACNAKPFEKTRNAYPRLRVEAEQLASSGTCGGNVWGQENDFSIPAGVHHEKGWATLVRPISKASNCLPQFRVRVYVAARSGGNDLCFHAARYSNLVAIAHDDDANAP